MDPNSDILAFLTRGFPNPADSEDKSVIDHWFKLDRNKSQILLHSKQTYFVNFGPNLTLRVER